MDDKEREIRARVEFKMNELLTAVENTARANWNISFQKNSQKHLYYMEAFEKMRGMFLKEMKMVPPCDEMAERNRVSKRNKAIDEIMERFCRKGDREYHHKEQLLVSIIDKAQYY